MKEPETDWTEQNVCDAFGLTPAELMRLAMQDTIPPPKVIFTGQRTYGRSHLQRLGEYRRLQSWQRSLDELRTRWDLDPNDIRLQARVTQLCSLRRLFGENNHQGLDELWEYPHLEADTIWLIVRELAALELRGDIFAELIALLDAKIVPPRYRRARG